MALRPVAARAWTTADAGSPEIRQLSARRRRAKSSNYKPMNDEATSTLASLLASLKTDSRCPDRPEDAGFRQGINRVATARNRKAT